MHDRLLQVSTPSNLVFIADRNSGNLDLKMDHLVCFMGGLLALGAYTDPQGLQSERAQRDLKTGKVSRSKKRTNVQSLKIDDVLECTSYYVL
jgi:mannosyl-oligosaccharide alpha-1,2-mannosidase